MSTEWEGIGVNGDASGEANQGVDGGNPERPECETLMKKYSHQGEISDGALNDGIRVLDESKVFVGIEKLEGANSEIISRKGVHGMDLKVIDKFDETKNRVVELMSRDSGWGSRGVMNLVGKVLGGKFCMDNDVEDVKISETGHDINSSVDQNGRHDVNREPLFENGSVINESVFGKNLHVGNSNHPRVESSLDGKQHLVINEQVLDDKSTCEGVLDCKSDCEGVPDSKSECEGSPYSKSKSQRVPDKSECQGQPDSKVEAEELGDVSDADMSFMEGIGEENKKEIEYNVSDIVWGKVRSHPWWPGQIFRPSAASDKGMEFFKKDCHLIAYFGDQTFSWNDVSKIKPFRMHFSEMEKQSIAEKFCHAVDCTLDEVARRVELGLSCMCLPKEVYTKLETQVVHNLGIQEKSSIIDGGDGLSTAALFLPGDLLQFIKSFAEAPCSGTDRLHLGITKAQLLAFSRWKGYYRLPILEQYGELLEDDTQFTVDGGKDSHSMAKGVLSDSIDAKKVPSKVRKSTMHGVSSRKSKHISNDEFPNIKEKHRNDEKYVRKSGMKMGSSNKKRGIGNSMRSDSNVKRHKNASLPSPSDHISSQLMSNLSVGERVYRAFESDDKCTSHTTRSNGTMMGSKAGKSTVNEKTPSNFDPDEILLKLNLAAKNPLQGHVILDSMIGLLHQIRNSIILEKSSVENLNKVAENCERKGSQDSYWTNRIIQGYPKEQVLPEHENPTERDVSATELDANISVIESSGNQNGTETSTAQMNEGSKECLPTALILNFTNSESIPAVSNLNEIFMRYGSLIESQTKILSKSKRAKIFFHKREDAETAFSSSGKYSIFGPSLISYSLHYTPTKTCTTSKRKRKAGRSSMESEF